MASTSLSSSRSHQPPVSSQSQSSPTRSSPTLCTWALPRSTGGASRQSLYTSLKKALLPLPTPCHSLPVTHHYLGIAFNASCSARGCSGRSTARVAPWPGEGGRGGAAAAAVAGGVCAPPGRAGCRAPVRRPGGERGGAPPAAPPASLCVAADSSGPAVPATARVHVKSQLPAITRLLPALLPAHCLPITRLDSLK